MIPWPTCGNGTICKPPDDVASRNPSYEKKKNARSFLIGAPIDPPKKFLSSGGRGSRCSPATAVPLSTCGSVGRKRPALLLKKSFAVVTVFRWKWDKEPCHSLVPDFVASDTCAPEERPVSALGFVVTTRNSCVASRRMRSTLENAWFVTMSKPFCCSLT